MFLAQLFEAIDKRHASFCFGRMNPPTVGHAQVINTVANSAQGGDYFVFVSQSQDSKKNPLDYSTKVKFIKSLFPEQANHVVYDPSLKTIIQVAHWLYAKGYRNVTFVAGSDRIESFRKLLTDYNGVEGPNGFYKFDSINFASSGDRDPDGEGLAGVSATAAREAAKAGNLQAFTKATGAGKLAEPLYHAVRKGMLVESINKQDPKPGYYFYNISADQHIAAIKAGLKKTMSGKWAYEVKDSTKWNRSPMASSIDKMTIEHADKLFGAHKFWSPVKEDASGYIPKNKREAKDPRWSNALSVDVTPKTPYKNAKALRLV